MKRSIVTLWAAALALLAGCGDSDPLELFGPGGNGTATSQAETVTPDTAVSAGFVPDDTEDNIANTEFDRTIRITFSSAGATVTGDEKGIVSVSGNRVTADNTETGEKIRYELGGTATDGYFKVYGARKQAFVLNGLHLSNPNGAAINNQCKKRTFVVLNGESSLADGSGYTLTPEGEDEKAAFFSEAQLIFSGSGSLSVKATGKSGITSDDYLRFTDQVSVKVNTSAGHGLRGKDAVVVTAGKLDIQTSAAGKKGISSDGTVRVDGGETVISVSGGVDASDPSDLTAGAGVKADTLFVMNAGSLTISSSGQGGKGISGDVDGLIAGGKLSVTVTGSNYGSSGGNRPGGGSTTDNSKSAKGIKFDGKLVITGGEVSVSAKNHEAIESKGEMVITGGTVYAVSSDDAVNSGGNMVVAGGNICAYSTGNDGLDANGNCYLQGGLVYAIGSGSPEVAVDANTEGGYRLHFSGGTLIAIGGLENGSALGQACYMANWSSGTWYALCQDGTPVFSFRTPTRGGSGLVVSTAGTTSLKSGVSTSGGSSVFDGTGVLDAAVSGGSEVSLSDYGGGSGMSGPGGMGGPGGWR